MYIQMGSITHCSLKAVSLKQVLVWEQWAECPFQGQGCGEEPLTFWVQLEGRTVLFVTFKTFHDLNYLH